MKTPYTIGQLARATGVPTSTVRYYERIGLLRPHGRTPGNYRVYGEEALERVRFIRAAQAMGFRLVHIAVLFHLRDGTTAGCQAVQALLEQRLSDVEQRMADVRHVQSVLKAALERCRLRGVAGPINGNPNMGKRLWPWREAWTPPFSRS